MDVKSVLIGKFTLLCLLNKVHSIYNHVKTIILKAYELVPEAYRQNFRNYKKGEKQKYTEFALSLKRLHRKSSDAVLLGMKKWKMTCILKWVSLFKALMGKSFKTVKAWPLAICKIKHSVCCLDAQ